MKLNDRIKAAVELQEQLKDFITLGRTQSKLTQKNNKDMIDNAIEKTCKFVKQKADIVLNNDNGEKNGNN